MKVRIYLLLLCIIGIIVFFSYKKHAVIIPFYYDQQVTITGTVSEVMDKFSSTSIVVDVEQLSYINIPNPSRERVLVRLLPGTRVVPTDRVVLSGTLDEIRNFITDTGSEFDYANYLQTTHIYGSMYQPQVTVVGREHGIRAILNRGLYHVRESIRDHIRSIFPLPVSALYSGMMIGDQSLFPPELLDVFRKSGLIHIMVLSGSNIALVAGFVFIWARRLGYYRRYIITGAVITLFVMMTGFAPPSVRALIMILATYVSRLLLRQYSGLYILLLTILVMLIINPLLARNVSFHLSILATYAIMFVAPIISERLLYITERYGLREIVAQTLSTQLIVVPYTIVSMGMFSLVGIVLNITVVPLTGLLTVAGYILTGISYIHTGLASIIGLPFTYLAHMIIKTSEIFVGLPRSFMYVSGVSSIILVAYYIWISKNIFNNLR